MWLKMAVPIGADKQDTSRITDLLEFLDGVATGDNANRLATILTWKIDLNMRLGKMDDAVKLAGQLVEALRTTDETERGLGFRALLRIGPEAAHAMSRLSDDVELAPYVTVWRIDTLTAHREEMDCSGDAERFVRLLGAVIELWGPVAAVTAWAGPAAGTDGLLSMVEQSWRVELPETEHVLAAIGSEHPDKPTSRAARKALFKYRTAR